MLVFSSTNTSYSNNTGFEEMSPFFSVVLLLPYPEKMDQYLRMPSKPKTLFCSRRGVVFFVYCIAFRHTILGQAFHGSSFGLREEGRAKQWENKPRKKMWAAQRERKTSFPERCRGRNTNVRRTTPTGLLNFKRHKSDENFQSNV